MDAEEAETSSPSKKSVLDYIRIHGSKQTIQWLHGFRQNLSDKTLQKSLQRLDEKYRKLNKSRKRQELAGDDVFQKWLAEPFMIPLPQTKTTGNEEGTIQEVDPVGILSSENAALKLRLESTKAELKRTASRETYQRNKVSKLELQASDSGVEMREELDDAIMEIDELSELRTDLQHRLKMSEYQATNSTETETVNVWDHTKQCYKPDFRNLIYKLLQEHVGLQHIPLVIEMILAFTHKKVDRLPSIATLHRMNLERLALAQAQVAEELAKSENLTLYSDETTKYSEKYMGYHVRDADKNYYVLGVRDLATKSADDTLSTFKEVIQDIDDQIAGTTSDQGRKILTNIRSTMSDRASTEKKWHELLEQYRSHVLPQIIEGYSDLQEEERQPLNHLNNFYCGLHSFVQLAEVTSAALLQIEQENPVTLSNGQFNKSDECGVVRLLRTASKAFARTGDQKSGCFGDFSLFLKDFLKENGLRSLPLAPFRGNRFNIIFFNGGHVWFLREKMLEYLTAKGNLNRLLNAVLGDLQQTVYAAGCKALGLISKLVTGPLWRIIEDNDVHVADMTLYISELLSALKYVCQNDNGIKEFMVGTFQPSQNSVWTVTNDTIYRSLIAESDVDDETEAALRVVLPAMTKVLTDHYEPFLTGLYKDMDSEMKTVTQSVDKHNKFAERVFAYTDMLLRFKPNVTHITQEAYVMFCLNKTSQWLDSKPETERHQLTEKSMKNVATLQKKYQDRRNQIKDERMKNQEAKMKEEAEKSARRAAEREMIHQDILYYGLYQSEEMMNSRLIRIKSKGETIEALKAQIRFREKILCQDADKALFKFSDASSTDGSRRQLSIEELKNNILTLIEMAKNKSIAPDIVRARTRLIGKSFVHKLSAEDSSIKEYKGTVISGVPGYPEWYNIEYEDDDDIYVEKLLAEIENKNLVITE